MNDRERIKQEIAYYTALIENHKKKTSSTSSRFHYNKTEPLTSSNSHAKSYGSSSQRRSVVPAGVKSGSDVAGRRTVVKPQASSSHSRTVIVPGKLGGVTSHANVPVSTQRGDNSRRCVVVTNPSSNKPATVVGHSSTTFIVNRQKSQHSVVNRYSSQGSIKANQFVWVNKKSQVSPSKVTTSSIATKHKLANTTASATPPKKLKSSIPARTVVNNTKLRQDMKQPVAASSLKPSPQEKEVSKPSSGRKTIVKSRYKLVKKSATSASSTSRKVKSPAAGNPSKLVNEASPRLKPISKYKLVKSEPLNARKRGQLHDSSYLSKSGKRLISRYKIRRRSKEGKSPFRKDYGSTPRLRSPRGCAGVSRFRVDRRTKISPYKIDKLANSRKLSPSVKLTTPPRRRSPYKWRSTSHPVAETFVSRYALQWKQTTPDSLKSPLKIGAARQVAGRALQKSLALSLRAKYKKNNTNEKHCLFYMRFGRCNRGDKCFYIHDPDRIAVCTRYLRGTCTIENCPFSHEAKKEKVPVCQHFLRGCCIRDGCPYLHVNVGRDAPICKNFAQLRYCHLGERCKKLHTDICPERNDSGSCPKGKRCKLRHPKKLTRSELLAQPKQKTSSQIQKTSSASQQPSASQDEQRSVTSGPVIAAGEKLTEALPAYISLAVTTTPQSSEGADNSKISFAELRSKKLKIKPSFLE